MKVYADRKSEVVNERLYKSITTWRKKYNTLKDIDGEVAEEELVKLCDAIGEELIPGEDCIVSIGHTKEENHVLFWIFPAPRDGSYHVVKSDENGKYIEV